MCWSPQVWGLDVAVPGAGGVARACLWYSLNRKEAMAELRLF